jgi:hypothetical protein
LNAAQAALQCISRFFCLNIAALVWFSRKGFAMKAAIMFLVLMLSIAAHASINIKTAEIDTAAIKLYPQLNENRPKLPSPFRTGSGAEYVVAETKDGLFGVIEVTLDGENAMCSQLVVDTDDFPALMSGLHSEEELAQTRMITGRSIAEITDLGRPGRLSEDGFMSDSEDILSLLKTDNAIVRRLELTHPHTAKPLFHLLNMMNTDLKLGRWNSSKHQWEYIPHFFYNSHKVFVEAHDTKGGQLSIFDDGIEGAFWMILKREMTDQEVSFLKRKYAKLNDSQFDAMKKALTTIYTGEMEPQYIMRYGFYEGHAGWRTDPLAISFIFGLKTIRELEQTFPGKLHHILSGEFTRDFSLEGEK